MKEPRDAIEVQEMLEDAERDLLLYLGDTVNNVIPSILEMIGELASVAPAPIQINILAKMTAMQIAQEQFSSEREEE